MFDNQKDPNQLHSVYSDPAYAQAVAEMKAELRRLRDFYHDPDPIKRVYGAKPIPKPATLLMGNQR
jgi:hypothetical protein